MGSPYESSQFLRCSQLVVVRAGSLFVSSRSPSRPISRLTVSFFLGVVISEAGSVRDDVAPPLRAHGVRGVSPLLWLLSGTV